MKQLSHLDENGQAHMVDISDKEITLRTAIARGEILVSEAVIEAVQGHHVPKGDVLAAARIAGIMGAKRTPELIPLCHTLLLEKVSIDLTVNPQRGCIECCCTVRTSGKTGAEMEALTGVSTALLTVYDMCKALDKGMTISHICVEEKTGGKSGHYLRNAQTTV